MLSYFEQNWESTEIISVKRCYIRSFLKILTRACRHVTCGQIQINEDRHDGVKIRTYRVFFSKETKMTGISLLIYVHYNDKDFVALPQGNYKVN